MWDCDDNDPAVYPGATEVCNSLDDDCDEEVDEELATLWYADGDGDGFGDPAAARETCQTPIGHVTNADDCDDNNNQIFPGNEETCDFIDNDCDGLVDGTNAVGATIFYVDSDLDGWGAEETLACRLEEGLATVSGDCDDTNADAHPEASEDLSDIDLDCDGSSDPSGTFAVVGCSQTARPSVSWTAALLMLVLLRRPRTTATDAEPAQSS